MNTTNKFRLRALHVSDIHGTFPKLSGKFDCVIHSGDFLPNSIAVMNRNIPQEINYQLNWLTQNIKKMKQWLQGCPFLFIPGNHDFLHPELMEQTLCAENIKAINLTEQVINHSGVSFYGFPYVPGKTGFWNYEREIPEMQKEVVKLTNALNNDHIDVLVTHCPLYGYLDLTNKGECIGSSVIANALDNLNEGMLPSYLLHGHDHEGRGIAIRNSMLISNAAYAKHIIEIV